MTNYVNGKKVENLTITPNQQGGYNITYHETFNINTAQTHQIMKKLRNNNIECQIFHNIKHNLIFFWVKKQRDLNGVIHTLNLENYHINYDDLIITIKVKKE